MTETSATIERMLEHRDALASLASALVRDPHEAADLEQDTWVAALEREPASNAPPRAWLQGVARNLSRRSARTRSRRASRERAASGPSPSMRRPTS